MRARVYNQSARCFSRLRKTSPISMPVQKRCRHMDDVCRYPACKRFGMQVQASTSLVGWVFSVTVFPFQFPDSCFPFSALVLVFLVPTLYLLNGPFPQEEGPSKSFWRFSCVLPSSLMLFPPRGRTQSRFWGKNVISAT